MPLLTLRSDGGNLGSTDSTLIEKHAQRERECAVAMTFFRGSWHLKATFRPGDLGPVVLKPINLIQD